MDKYILFISICVCMYMSYMYVYIHNGILFSHEKGNSAASWMDLECICQTTQVRQRKTNLYDIICMWNIKYNINEWICETDSQI